MPRDGSNIYHTPAGTQGVTNTTIASTPYNGYLADIEADLNIPRPIVAGGTGANNAATALTNLGGENANQVVTNYDSFPFAAGSFNSAAGATSAPTANAFRGIAYITDSSNITVEARDNTTGLKYTRQKTAGVWGTWSLDMSTQYVAKAGDTMTGDLKLQGTGPDFILTKNSGTAGTQCNVWGMTNNVPRWVMQFGNETNEAGSNAGSDFTLQRYSDAGAFLGNSFICDRSDSSMSVFGALWAQGSITSATTGTTGSFNFGNSGSKYLNYDGTSFNLSGGDLSLTTGGLTAPGGGVYCVGNITSATSGTTGGLFFGNSSTKFLTFNGTAFSLTGGDLNASGFVVATGYKCRSGASGSYAGSVFNINTGTGQQLWIDNINSGTFAYTSDYRTKKDVTALPDMWEAVKALRPIKYTQAQFSPPAHLTYIQQMKAEGQEVSPLYIADGIERWGFLAHELQQTLTPSASSGVKDAPDTIQSPNPFTIIAALTKALQEAMTRIEALEAKGR